MDPFIGEIRMFTGNFAPVGWLFCHGQSLDTDGKYEQLYAVIGTAYESKDNGSFCLPDFRGKVPLHQGQGPGLSAYRLGQSYGSETISLTFGNLPQHNHQFFADTDPSTSNEAAGHIIASYNINPPINYYKKEPSSEKHVAMNDASISQTGSSKPHSNMQPYLAFSFIICYEGVFPPRP